MARQVGELLCDLTAPKEGSDRARDTHPSLFVQNPLLGHGQQVGRADSQGTRRAY